MLSKRKLHWTKAKSTEYRGTSPLRTVKDRLVNETNHRRASQELIRKGKGARSYGQLQLNLHIMIC